MELYNSIKRKYAEKIVKIQGIQQEREKHPSIIRSTILQVIILKVL